MHTSCYDDMFQQAKIKKGDQEYDDNTNPEPCTFNYQDLEDLTISLVDGIMPKVQKHLQENEPSLKKVPASYIGDLVMNLKSIVTYHVDQILINYFGAELEKDGAGGCEEGGKHDYELSPGCGVNVCIKCGDHKGLARCYCGWNLAPGERLEDDVDY
jgi:hypothetical protein